MNKSSLAFMLLVFAFAGLGSYFGSLLSTNNPSLQLDAATALENEGNVSVLTGIIETNTGGIYIFDHDTGQLQCWMIDRKSGEIVGIFNADVFKDMLFDKVGKTRFLIEVDYVLESQHKGVKTRAGDSTCFVTETISGKIIAYQVAYDKNALTGGRLQEGELKKVWNRAFRAN